MSGFIAGSNIPGYMPDDVAEFDTLADAASFIAAQIESDADAMGERAPVPAEDGADMVGDAYNDAYLMASAIMDGAGGEGVGEWHCMVDADAIAPLGRVYWIAENDDNGGE